MNAQEKLAIRVEMLELAQEIIGQVSRDPDLISSRLRVHPETLKQFRLASAPIGASAVPRGAPGSALVAAGIGSALFQAGEDGDRFMGYRMFADPSAELGRVELVKGPRSAAKS